MFPSGAMAEGSAKGKRSRPSKKDATEGKAETQHNNAGQELANAHNGPYLASVHDDWKTVTGHDAFAGIITKLPHGISNDKRKGCSTQAR